MKTLQTGKSYKARNGDWFFIRKSDNHEYPFIGSNEKGDEWYYASNGFVIGIENELDLSIPDEPQVEVKPEVPHLDVILATVQKIPVQYDFLLSGRWHDFSDNTDVNPVDYPEYNWRIKPQPEPKRTVQIGKRTVVAPEVRILHCDCEYFYAYKSQGNISRGVWSNHRVDKSRLELGNVFMTEQDAINCQEAIKALLLGKD